MVRLCFVDPGKRTKRDPRPPQRLHYYYSPSQQRGGVLQVLLSRHVRPGTSGLYHVYYKLLLLLGLSVLRLFVTMVPFNTAWPTLLSVQLFCSFQVLTITSQSMVCHFCAAGKLQSVSNLQENLDQSGPQNTLKCRRKHLRFQNFPGDHPQDPSSMACLRYVARLGRLQPPFARKLDLPLTLLLRSVKVP